MADHVELEILEIVFAVRVDEGLRVVHHDVVQVDLDPFSVERMAALGVDHLALCVHHVVVFEQAFTDTEVVLFDFALGPFDRPRHHTGLDHFSLFEAHTVHQLGDTLRAEQAHQVILERYEEERGARSPWTPGTAAQLAVHTARFVALGYR